MTAESAREDTGYMRYQLSRDDTLAGMADKIKIIYIKGMLQGKTVTMRRDFADDLINRGFAKEV
jgi:hypothetical protein